MQHSVASLASGVGGSGGESLGEDEMHYSVGYSVHLRCNQPFGGRGLPCKWSGELTRWMMVIRCLPI
jgi:hypothetical protein